MYATIDRCDDVKYGTTPTRVSLDGVAVKGSPVAK